MEVLRMSRSVFKRIVWSVVALLLPIVSFGKSPKIAPDLAAADPQGVATVIVQFNRPPDAAEHARVAQLGGVRQADLDAIQGAVYSLPVRALEALANNPNVLYVSP